ncbi:MAG TPA: beta-ketoacyl synthase N-terminal-like domain-containing protein, partial [Micromonospora sp.]
AIAHAWRALAEPLVVASAADADGLRALLPGADVVDAAELAALPGAAGGQPRPAPAADPDSVAMLQLSSGSTGTPKIIQITHRGVSQYAVGAREMLGVRPTDTLLNWLPLDHVAGLMLYHLGGVFLGASTVQVDTGHVLADPLRWLDLMQDLRVTHSWAPNFGYRMVADAAAGAAGRRWDLRTVRRLVSGGDQCSPETFAAFLAATSAGGVTAAALTPAWGMSETCTGITFASLGDPDCRQRVRLDSRTGEVRWVADDEEGVEFLSVGPPAPGTTLRVVDRAGRVLPEGWVGRLQVRSARVTPGYLGDPDADRAAFPEPGWLETGDLAFMVDGRITVTGREKELVILNGHNLPCEEIERVAGRVVGVRAGSVAACGLPDPGTGTERLVIFYVPESGGDEPDPQRRAAVAAAVGDWLRIPVADVVAVAAGEFPRTSGGKIQRVLLRERYLAGAYAGSEAHRAATPEPVTDRQPGRAAPVAVRRVVLDAVTAISGTPVDPTRPFHELGLGSVQLVRLRARLSDALGREIPQPVLFAHPSVDSLAAALAGDPAPRARDADPAPRARGADRTGDRRVAVIGMAVRFPGATTVAEYWANLTGGVSSLRLFTAEELAAAGVDGATAADPDFVPVSGALTDVAGFDAGFFGITAREAELLDPQHRLFLEVCHHALEDAGYPGGADQPRIGLFAGSGMTLYSHHTYLRNNLGPASASPDPATSMGVALGNQPDFLATRVAYRLGLTGPAIGVQTACSTSLVAVHLAIGALLAGDADIALAGAAAVHVPQVTGYRHTEGSILSPRGRCRPFDADADGTVGGNGIAAVVLKPLDRALADGDTVHAVIAGSAVINDGAGKVGFTAPGVPGQVEVIRRALRVAGVPAESVGYVEAHGTGTALGDPV